MFAGFFLLHFIVFKRWETSQTIKNCRQFYIERLNYEKNAKFVCKLNFAFSASPKLYCFNVAFMALKQRY